MSNGDLKIGDWGIAVEGIDASKLDFEAIEKSAAQAGTSGAGTPYYMAPENCKIGEYICKMKLENAKAEKLG